VIVRWVSARGWPWHTSLTVKDEAGRLLAYDPASPASLSLPRHQRTEQTLERLASQQDLLQMHYASGDEVRLGQDGEAEERLAELVGRYGIDAELLDFERWKDLRSTLACLGPERMWELVADWYDEYQAGQAPGASRSDPPQWLQLAHPERATYWTWLSSRIASGADGWQVLTAHLASLSVDTLTLYDLLHCELALATEFAGRAAPDTSHLGL
jgi:hypothetical protein